MEQWSDDSEIPAATYPTEPCQPFQAIAGVWRSRKLRLKIVRRLPDEALGMSPQASRTEGAAQCESARNPGPGPTPDLDTQSDTRLQR